MKTTVVIQQEPVAFAKECEDILREHYEEVAWRKDKIKFAPDYPIYDSLEKAGILRCYVARRDGIIVGYAVFFVKPHFHYKHTLVAANDILYVEKSSRGYVLGKRLLSFAEGKLKAEGVHYIGLHIKDCLDWSPLALKLGYESVERQYQKWIGG